MSPPRYPPPTPSRPGNPGVWGTAGAPVPTRIPVKKKKAVVTKTKPVVATVPPPPVSLAAQASQQVGYQIDPQITAVNNAASANANSLKAAYEALSQLRSNIPGQVEQTYTNAANSTAGFAKGFSDALQSQASGAAQTADEHMQQLGLPQQVVSKLATGGTDALYATGGYIPASSLAREGAAQTTAARGYQDQALGLGIDALKGSDQQRLQAIQQIEATRPGLLQQAMQGLQDRQTQAANAAALAQYRTDSLAARGGRTAAGAKTVIRSLANGQLQAFDPYTGRPLGKPYGPTKPVSTSSASGRLSYTKDAAGNLVAFNPYTGKSAIVNPAGWVLKPPKAGGGAKAAKVTVKTDKSGRPYTIVNGKVKLLPIPPGFTTHTPGASGGASGSTAGLSPSTISNTIKRAEAAGTAALDAVLAKIRAGVPGADLFVKYSDYLDAKALNPKDPNVVAFETAKREAQRRVQQNFGTAVYRVISEIGPHLKAIGYSPAAVKWKAFQIVSAVITPPKNYRTPRNVQPGKGEAANAAYTVQQAGNVIGFAASQIGKPYVFGSGPDFKSFDCSDLIQAAYKQIGISLPRTTYGQIKAGRPVSLQNIQPGDLVFPSRGHVVLYVGDGKVIAAPHTGALVQYEDLAQFGNPVAIRRVLPDGTSYV